MSDQEPNPKAFLTPLTSKLKQFELHIPKDSTWADDAEEEPTIVPEEEKQTPENVTPEEDDHHHIPLSGVRIPSSRKRSRRVLSTPTPEDPLEIIELKLRDIALAVQDGENAALITDYNMGGGTIPQVEVLNPTEHAKQGMKLLEREQYDAWELAQTQVTSLETFQSLNLGSSPNYYPLLPRDQFVLPRINWETDKTPLPKRGDKTPSLARFTKRAAALATAYSLQNSSISTPEHAYHFTLNHPDYLPLLSALTKVSNARRSVTGDRETLSSLDLAEVRVMKAVNGVASRAVEEAYKGVREVAGRIARSQRVLRERENEIKSGVEGYRVKNFGGVGTRMR